MEARRWEREWGGKKRKVALEAPKKRGEGEYKKGV